MAHKASHDNKKHCTSANCGTPLQSSGPVHIIVDNSNVFIGAQLGQGKSGEQDVAVRVNVGKVVQLIERKFDPSTIKTRIVGGSGPSREARVWREWGKCQYKCVLGERSAKNQEVFLDDMLHAQILNLILKYRSKSDHGQQTLVLVTGDGNTNNNLTNFPDVVSTALQNGWRVRLWSWETSCSGKFIDLQRKYPTQMKVNYFDPHRSVITFR